MEWEQKLAEADQALAELDTTDDEIESICRRAANGSVDLAEIDARLDELADGSIELTPMPSLDLDAFEVAPLQDEWAEDAETVYAPAGGMDGQAYAELIEESGVEEVSADEVADASVEAKDQANWEDEPTMAADIVETEDGEFVLMVDEDDIELVEDDSGVEPVKGKEAEAKAKEEKEDKSFLRRLFSRS